MNSNLFFYLFYNIHNGSFLNRLRFKWFSKKYIYLGHNYYETKLGDIFNPLSLIEFAENAEYFIEKSGFYKELNLFTPQYYHYLGESLYSLELDFICMAYAKKTMSEIFTVENSYELFFAIVASEYSEHTKKDKIQFIERETFIKKTGIKSKSNFGYTNSRLGFFSNAILKKIQDTHIVKPHTFTSHEEIYEYFSKRWENNSILLNELLIAKKIIDCQFITPVNLNSIAKMGFTLNNDISLLVRTLIEMKNLKVEKFKRERGKQNIF
jgi:hypothetical protein